MKKIFVRAPATRACGYGEQARFALQALKAHEDRFDIYLEDIKWGNTGKISLNHPDRLWYDSLAEKTHHFLQNGGRFDISLQITIPNEWDTKYAPHNVGYTAGIETHKIAPHWIEPSNKMDKIIVVSDHAKFGFENTTYQAKNEHTGEVFDLRVKTDVERVSYSARTHLEKDETFKLDLDTDFNFLSVCQWGPRKNLEATIVSFMEEFHDDEVGLVLKTNIVRNNTKDRQECEKRLNDFLVKYPNRKCKVYLLHGNLRDSEMSALYTHPKIKAIVSTAHGEGFGLPLFEAVCNGLPVIAVNWSGQTDFLYAPFRDKKGKTRMKPHFLKIDYEIKPVQQQAVWEGVIQPDSKWAFVKKQSVRENLRNMYKTHSQRKGIANKLQKYVLEKFNEEDIYEQFVNAIHEVEDEWESELDEIVEA